MQITNELYNLLENLSKSLNNVLKYHYISSTDKNLERFLYTLEKWRFEIYEQVRFLNDITEGNEIHFIDNDYKATLKADVLSLYIPEKLPNLKNRSSYAHKQIILNIAEITKPYERLFYNKFVIVVVKIFEKSIWYLYKSTVY